MAYPRYRKARAHKTALSSGSDYNITAWQEIDATHLSISIAAEVGDDIELSVAMYVVPTGACGFYLDFGVAGSRISGSNGCYRQSINSGWDHGPFGYLTHTIVSGDLVLGVATFRPWAQCTSATAVIHATNPPVLFVVKNLGPPAPH